MPERSRDARIEPLFAALEEESALEEGRAGKHSLRWKIVWAVIVLTALVVLVLKQSY